MKTKKILLVDDDGLALATFGKGLKNHGYTVYLADSGEEAMRIVAEEQSLDLAILDMRMPGLSGIELAKQLASLTLPFIFLSAFDDETDVKQAILGGALAYLVKPIDVEKTIPTIEAALQRAEDIQSLRDTEKRLGGALETGNLVNVAVGILMERHRLGRQDAFEMLRSKARDERRKVKELANDMLNVWGFFNIK